MIYGMPKLQRSSWLLMALFVTLIILVACFMPARNVPKVEVPLMDKWVHVAVFAALAFCWSAYFSRRHLAATIMLVLACAAFGLAIEIVQGTGWISKRSFEWNDFFADLAGALIGAGTYRVVAKRLIGPLKKGEQFMQ